MREILFRAKEINTGEWVEGYLYRLSENQSPFIMLKNKLGIAYEVEEHTICQYTGLTDRNGNKIWENDLVDINHYATKSHKVKYEYGTFCVGINGLLYRYRDNCRVIGNAFDNSELLEGE